MKKAPGMPQDRITVPAIILAFVFIALAAALPVAIAQTQPAQQPATASPSSSSPQSQTQPPAQSSGNANPADDQKPTETLKVNVNVVGVFFNVKDKRGALIPNLTKEDFEVLEDGKPQAIKYFAAESNLPLTLGILIDTSGSQRNVLDMEKEVGGAFLRQILTDKDEAYVMSFDVESDLIQDYTRDVHRLQNAMNKTQINAGVSMPPIFGGGGPLPSPGSNAGTVLYDAVYLSAHDMLSKEVGRKAMILLTDGDDQGSKLKLQDAIEAAQKADAIVYVLLCADRGFYGAHGAFYSGEGEMKKLTETTGGRMINVGNKLDKLRDAFDQIAAELRSQYNVGYTPLNASLDGSYRKLDIKSKQNYKVQARAGYYATRRDQN